MSMKRIRHTDAELEYLFSDGPQLKRFNVVLKRPEVPLMQVVSTVRKLTHFAEAEATNRMWEAVHTGRSVVLSTHLERAELIAEQFGKAGLAVELEPVL